MFFLSTLLSLSLLVKAQYTPSPRWGQAAVLVNSNLYVHGGKIDQYNSISYTQAPGTSEILYLDLSRSFDASSVPWELVSADGPAVAWHSISATNTSLALSFGGLPDANTEPVLPDQRDSSWLLDVSSTTEPRWINVDHPWAEEPPRRIHHTATTLPDGRILIIGGQRTDGSNIAHSDHFLLDPSVPQYIPLNTTGEGPPDVYGHAALMHPEGYVVIIGGISPSAGGLVPFNTIYALDIKHPQPYWSPVSIEGAVPPPRVDFAAAVLSDGRILVHGGSDGSVGSAFDDGWVVSIDFIGRTGSWSAVPELSQLGARKDHFIVSSGDNVLVGFGYGANGPASSGLQIFNPGTGSFDGTYNPPDSSPPPSPTMPGMPGSDNGNGGDGGPNPTGGPGGPGDGNGNGGGNGNGNGGGGNGNGGGGGSGDGNGGGNGNGGDGSPGGGNGNGGGDAGGGGDGGTGGDGSGDEDDNGSTNKTTGIAVGVALGVLALLAAGTGTALYIRKQRREQQYAGQFRQINDTDPDGFDEESPHYTGSHNIPAAHMHGGNQPHQSRGLLGAFGLHALTVGARHGRAPERKDMLADEDTRQFDAGRSGPYKQSSTGSSWSLFSAFGGRRSREPSMAGTPWTEKGDPFTDGSALLRDDQSGFVGAAAPTAVAATAIVRPRGAGRQTSYASSRSGRSYRDPFADPSTHDYHNLGQSESEDEVDAGRQEQGVRRYPSYSDHPPPAITTLYPLSNERHLLSPLSEATSRQSLSDPSNTSQSSHDHGSTQTSLTSYDRVPSPKQSSLLDGQAGIPGRPVARSDTWWNRFSKTSFLDRRGSTTSRHTLDFRDPNPPPVRLSAIEEKSAHSQSPESQTRKTPPSASSSLRRKNSLYTSVIHGKSTSSIRTADTAAIERMGGMDVVRLGSGSHRTRSSVGSSFDDNSLLDHSLAEVKQVQIPVVASPVEGIETTHEQFLPTLATIPSSSSALPEGRSSSPPEPGPSRSPPTKRMSNLISSRVDALQSRVAQEQEVLPPTNTRSREERVHKPGKKSVSYGVVPRASLFVANPEA